MIQRLRLKATIACFGAVHKLLFGERNNPSLKVTKSLIPFVFLSCFGVTQQLSFKYKQDSIPGSLNLTARGGCHKYGAINDVTSVGRGSIQDVNPMRCNL